MNGNNKVQNNNSSLYEYAETSGTELYVSKNPDLSINRSIFKRYLDKVFELRPNIKEIYDETKGVDLVSYDKKHIRENRNPIIRARKSELISVVQKNVQRLLGSKIADSVAKQLKGNDSVSTAQHSASLGHYVLKLTLQNALPYFNSDNPNLQNVIVLACSDVSFNNSSTPRSMLLHTKQGLDYLPFFGRAVDASPVIFHPAYTHESIENMLKEVEKIENAGGLNKFQVSKLKEILDDIYSSPHVLSAKYYTDQITIVNYYLFKNIFNNYPSRVPNLVYLSQEEIVSNLILEFHLQNRTTIHNVLFDPKMHQLLEKYFDKAEGAFSIKEQKGTFLFWGYDKQNKSRIKLFRQGNSLVSVDGSFRIELVPEVIRDGLESKKIIPTVMLSFFVLAFYYGLLLTGAYKQSYDLPRLLSKYIKMLKEYGDKEGILATEDLITSNLIVPASILYLKDPGGEYVPATALDILINPEKQAKWEELFASYKQIPFSEVIVKMFPIIYNRLCPQKQKEEKLASITEQDLDQFTGFPKKIPPIVDLGGTL